MHQQSNVSVYWKCQIIGWSMVALYYGYVAYTGTDFSIPFALLHFVTDVLICIVITHLFRKVSKKYRWQELSFKKLLLRIIPSGLLLGFLYMGMTLTKLYIVHTNFRAGFTQTFSSLSPTLLVQTVFSFILLFYKIIKYPCKLIN